MEIWWIVRLRHAWPHDIHYICYQSFLTRVQYKSNTGWVSFIIRSVSLQETFFQTRPKPAYGRQGLDWDRWARIQFSQVHFGAKLDSTDLLWCKNVTSPTGESNRPFGCLEEGGRALPKFLAPFQNVSKKHSGYDLLLNKYSGGYRKITIWM